jgi:hypothetical protein
MVSFPVFHCGSLTRFPLNIDSDPIKRRLKTERLSSILESPYQDKMVRNSIICFMFKILARGFLLICFEARKYNFIVRLKSKF